MREIWDISRALTPELAPWPGDQPFGFNLNARIAAGSSVNIGALSMSVHNGTRADAPFHFDDNGRTIDEMPLQPYLGAAVVVDLTNKFRSGNGAIEVSDLGHAEDQIARARRLLLKTNCFAESARFPEWIPVLEPATIAWLRDLHLLLLGVDVPSVDPITARHLANHHALHAAGIAIVESLDLRAIEPGEYQIAALPLPVEGGDGAPVRAILWRD